MSKRPDPANAMWTPRENLPGQTDLIPELDRVLAEDEAARHAAGANGGPTLAAAPCFEDLARIGRAVHGRQWEGKLASVVSEDPRTLRRWRAGEGAPSARAVATARAWAVELASEVLRAAGEPDLAEPLQAHLGRVRREARERGRGMLAASMSGHVSLAKPPRPSPRPSVP